MLCQLPLGSQDWRMGNDEEGYLDYAWCEINRDSLALFMRHNYIPTPHSIYKGIYKLLPGTMLILTAIQLVMYPAMVMMPRLWAH